MLFLVMEILAPMIWQLSLQERDMDDYIKYALDTQSKKFEQIKKYE